MTWQVTVTWETDRDSPREEDLKAFSDAMKALLFDNGIAHAKSFKINSQLPEEYKDPEYDGHLMDD